MKNILAKLWAVFETLLDPDGKLSFGRFATFVLLVAVVSWDSCYVFMSWKFNLAHPDFHIPIGDMLPSVATLIGQVTFMTSFYVATKVQEASIKANDNATKVAMNTTDGSAKP